MITRPDRLLTTGTKFFQYQEEQTLAMERARIVMFNVIMAQIEYLVKNPKKHER